MQTKTNTCLYVEWYKFHKCEIRTCKNFTSITRTSCLALDRVNPSGVRAITDAELHMYKYPEAKVSTRLIALKRKAAVDRVKAMLVLRELIEFIREKNHVGQSVETPATIKLESLYPLKVKKLKFESWMWPHIVSTKTYEEFLSRQSGECSQIYLHQLLNITAMKFDALARSLTKEFEND